jgi:hypothetical protein
MVSQCNEKMFSSISETNAGQLKRSGYDVNPLMSKLNIHMHESVPKISITCIGHGECQIFYLHYSSSGIDIVLPNYDASKVLSFVKGLQY